MEEFIRASTTKEQLVAAPQGYPWNIVLRIYQFTPAELLRVRNFCDVADIVRFQTEATYTFVYNNFRQEVDDSDQLDWDHVMRYTSGR